MKEKLLVARKYRNNIANYRRGDTKSIRVARKWVEKKIMRNWKYRYQPNYSVKYYENYVASKWVEENKADDLKAPKE